jgi:hypothetical protein
MRDFTLEAYSAYLSAIKANYKHILRFDEYFLLNQKPESFCIIRHDIDRKPYNALQMANLEHDLGVKATYYFRTKPHTFKPEIICKIEKLGHEIGYHYESLSDTNGDIQLALENFRVNLRKLRKIVQIRTIAMHGRPFKKFDNRDLWRTQNNHVLLFKQFGILGEVYLDINYSDIAYLSDTGRNWENNRSNIRDKVASSVNLNVRSGYELLQCLQQQYPQRIIFQIHPERWTDNLLFWIFQLFLDTTSNSIKFFYGKTRCK